MNSKKTIIVATIIAIIIYNVLMFIMPVHKNINFWIIYVSSMISILFAGGVFFTTLTKKGIQKKVKELPLNFVAWEYFIAQIIIGFIELLHPMNYRISLIINVILLGINTIALSIVSTEKKEIERVEKKVQGKVLFIKLLHEDIETIKGKIEDEKIRRMLEDLSEKVRYSDPMSTNKLFEIEDDIEIKMSKLKEKIEEKKYEEVQKEIEKIKMLLAERNRKIKIYKGMPEEDEKEEKNVNARTVIISSVSIIVLIVVGIVSYYSIILPNSQYSEAEKLLSNKQYKEASIAFKKMNGYKNSEEKASEAMYQYATDLFEQKQYTKATEEYSKLLEYKDSKDKIKEITYTYATELFEKKEYKKSKEEFAKLENYKDSEEKGKQASYLYALELLENKEYSKSASEFLALDNYKDSKEKVIEIYNLFGEQDVLYFGKYKENPIAWQIVETKEHQVLLIARDVIDEMVYNKEFKAIEWKDSDIRKWLNEEFYNSFDEKEKQKIVNNGEEKVFLFTNKNVEKYKKIKNTSKSWWIATNGNEKTKAMYVKENGTIEKGGDIVTKLHGVRPAIWINLD